MAYNIYGKRKIELKIGDLKMHQFSQGDKVDIPDGVYVGSGVVVIHKGKFVAEFDHLVDKWGDPIDVSELLSNRNPVKTLDEVLEKRALALVLGRIEKLNQLPLFLGLGDKYLNCELEKRLKGKHE
jgi:hypothetical protein